MRGKNREKILEAGFTLFYENGFEATGVQEIATASGVPKGSFYNYFPSKTAFAVVVIELYAERQAGYLQMALNEGEGAHLARLKGMLETWMSMFFSPGEGARGCLAGNLIQELANHEDVVQVALHEATNKLESYFAASIRAAQEAGEISKDLDAQDTGAFLYNSWQGAMLRAKCMRSTDPFRQLIDLIFKNILK